MKTSDDTQDNGARLDADPAGTRPREDIAFLARDCPEHEVKGPGGADDAGPGTADGRALNRRSYDAIASRWDAARVRLSAPELRFLHALVRDLPPRARILDLGCGSGRPMAEHLLAAGFAVTGVDQSSALLELARTRYPAGEWIESALEHYEPQRRFGAAIAWDSLFHVPRREHLPIFRRVCASLACAGRFMLTVGGSAHPPFTDEMFGEPFFYDSHPPEVALALLHAAGFEVETHEFLNAPTSGRDKGRVAILARRIR